MEKSKLLRRITLLLLAGLLVVTIPQVHAAGSLARDGGVASGTVGDLTHGGSTCVTSTSPLTTTKSPDVVIAMMIENGTIAVSTVTDTASLTWTLRASQAEPDNNGKIFEYYAIATGVLSSDQVTFTMVSAVPTMGCEEFAFSGANTSLPFDSNGAIPFASSSSSTSTITVTYTTNNPNDILIYFYGLCRTAVGQTGPTGGFGLVGSSFGVNGVKQCPANGLYAAAYTLVVTVIQSSTSYTAGAANNQWAVIGDAIQGVGIVNSVSPAFGGIGQAITITGNGFTGATSVTVCGVSMPVFTVTGDTQITMNTPIVNAATLPSANVLCDIIVTTGAGASPAVTTDQYTYTSPSAGGANGLPPPATLPAGSNVIIFSIFALGIISISVLVLSRHKK